MFAGDKWIYLFCDQTSTNMESLVEKNFHILQMN